MVITGDLVDLSIDLIKDDLQPLSQLNAPCYFIPGNHEYFHGVHEINEFITTLGIKPLLNDSVLLGKSDQIFNLVGLTDVVGDRLNILKPDIKKAYSSVDKNRPCIVLAHQPKFIERMHKQRCDLMLSGHTHGGQIFPFGFLVMFAQPYLSGLYQHNQDQQIFVSRGAGYWGPPVRILAPSEITQLIIHSS